MSASVIHPREQAGGYWSCQNCGLLNLPYARACENQRCGERRPPAVERGGERQGAAA